MRILVPVLIFAVGCAHVQDQQEIARNVEHTRALIEALPTCTGDEPSRAVAIGEVAPTVDAEATLRGRLSLAQIVCTLLACPGRECCNGCGGRLAVGGASERSRIVLTDPDDPQAYTLGGADCSLSASNEVLARIEVIVHGRFGPPDFEDSPTLLVQSLCRVP